MTAAVHDIVIEQNATFDETWVWQDTTGAPVNVTGYTARLQVRRVADVSSPALVTITEATGIVLGGVLGTINPVIAAAVTLGLYPGVTGLRYDLRMVAPGGKVTRLMKGAVTVDPAVTQ